MSKQVVGEDLVEPPDLVQHLQLLVGVKAQVTNELADMGPVLLFNVSSVVLVARSRPRERDLVGLAVVEQVSVDELCESHWV